MVAPRAGERASARACESRRRGACDVYGGGEARGGAAGLPFRRAPRRRGGGDAATANVQRPQPPRGARRGAHGPARVEPMAAAARGIALTGHSPGSRGSSAPAGGRRARGPGGRGGRRDSGLRGEKRASRRLALREARATANAAAATAAAATSTRFSLGMATNPGLAPRPRPRLWAVRTWLLPLRAPLLAALTSPSIPGIGCAVGVRVVVANYSTAFPLRGGAWEWMREAELCAEGGTEELTAFEVRLEEWVHGCPARAPTPTNTRTLR